MSLTFISNHIFEIVLLFKAVPNCCQKVGKDSSSGLIDVNILNKRGSATLIFKYITLIFILIFKLKYSYNINELK